MDGGEMNQSFSLTTSSPDESNLPGIVMHWRKKMPPDMEKGAMQQLQYLLHGHANPNERCEYTSDGFAYNGTPLTIAAKFGAGSLVKCLLEGAANPDTTYSVVGVNDWCAHVAYDVAVSGHLEILKQLAMSRANLQGRLQHTNGEPNGTLLFAACFNGHIEIVKYLLSLGEDANVHVKNQADTRVLLTPLHAAVRNGRCDILKILMSSTGDLQVANKFDEDGTKGMPTLLIDAIESNATESIKFLVASSANPFCQRGNNLSDLDYALGQKNSVAIAALADGLKTADEALIRDELKVPHLTAFLSTPGEAPQHILHAIFRPRELKVWNGSQRVTRKTAYLHRDGVNVADGPDVEFFNNLFSQRRSGESSLDESPEEKRFNESLFGSGSIRGSRRHAGANQVPIEVYQCIISHVWSNPEFIWAFLTSPNMAIFESWPGLALTRIGWERCRRKYLIDVCVQLMHAIFYCFLCRELNAPLSYGELGLPVVVIMLVILGFRELYFELSRSLAFKRMNRLRAFIISDKVGTAAMYEKIRVVLNTVLLIMLVFLAIRFHGIRAVGRSVPDFHELNLPPVSALMAINVFLRWVKLLTSMRGLPVLGPKMIPIMYAWRDVVPFVIVTVFPFAGFVHMYFALGIEKDLFTAVMTVYRMAFLADFEINEFAKSNAECNENANQNLTEGIRIRDPRYCMVNMSALTMVLYWIMVFLTFTMTIVLMNIMISVVCDCYNRSCKFKDRYFAHERAEIWLLEVTMKEGYMQIAAKAAVWRRKCKRLIRLHASSPRQCDSRSSSLKSSMASFVLGWTSAGGDYVWYCRREEKADTAVENTRAKEIVEMRERLSQVERTMGSISKDVDSLRSLLKPKNLVPT